MDDLPEGFRIDPGLSQQFGTTVAVNDEGRRIRWAGKGAGNPNKVYAETLAREKAKGDVARLEAAGEGERNAYGMEATANRGLALLDRTPTGPLADLRIDLGRAVGGTPLSILPGIPNREETTNLELFRNIGSQGALGDVSKLKGPLSEKELAFIQRLQADPNATKETNRQVLEAQKWVARRRAAYANGLRTWTSRLGSPSATNPRGQTFDAWWGQYSAERLPPPGVGAPAKASSGSASASGGGGAQVKIGDSVYEVREK